MKGRIKKYIDSYYISKDRVYSDDDYMIIEKEDIDEFMDDIYSQYLEGKGGLLERVERTAMELVEARKSYLESEKEQAYNKGFREGFNVKYGFVKQVITKQEEVEQDKDEQEMTKTYNNPFPTEEQLIYDINVRERD